ncbi:NAD(P)H-binding protein [Nocardia wallacei]|uniref:NAD(P)H-binding protein n=1 Tax=Nocardia wallacei TaxID=480035 RepID=UPI00245614A9|nr:NAD(P)H-binding protein [Nocardia wallacei]
MRNGTTVVVGGTGKTGRLVAAGVRERGDVVRTAARAGADVRFDWFESATWAQVLGGAGAVYLVTPMDPDFPAERVGEFVTAAEAAGVRRLVLLSGLSAGYGSVPMASRETPVRESGLEWTILRPGAFAQNFDPGERTGRALAAGELRLPVAPRTRVAYIDVRDIADVAIETLTADGHSGRIYTLTGARAVSYTEAVALISAATGKQARFTRIPLPDWITEQRAAGIRESALDWSLETFAAQERGAYAHLHPDVHTLLGRAPRPFTGR